MVYGGSVIVGISGGPDSVCLLHILSRIAPEFDLKLYAVHVNHGLRGAAADADEAWTADFCQSLGVPCEIVRVSAAVYAEEQGLTVEEAGRRLRYEAFENRRKALLTEEKCLAPEAVRIAVAHNADDQAETVLMRILRGTGTAGLAGMEYLRADGLIRPLLDISRADIETYCREQSLAPRLDLSNLETDYTRNRIRLELLPYLREQFNPNITEALTRLAAIAGEERAWTDGLAEDFLQTHGLNLAALKNAPASLRKRALLLALKAAGLTQDVSAVHLETCNKLILTGSVSDKAELPHGFSLRLDYETLEILPPGQPESPINFCRPLNLNGTTELPELRGKIIARKLTSEEYLAVRSCTEKSVPSDFSEQIFLSIDGLVDSEKTLEIRVRQSGDFIRPFGMKGRKLLQNYFVDRKVPREIRDRLPLLSLGQEILWVPAVGINEICRISPATESILSLEYFVET